MKTITIDEEFCKFLHERAIPYEEKNELDTIKRLVGFKTIHSPSTQPRRILSRSKQEKTNLPELVTAGILQEGQTLVFTDYQRRQHHEHNVILRQGRLIYQARDYSMSELASILLKRLGFNSSVVRGPQFWSTSSGDLVRDLWSKYLEDHQDDRTKITAGLSFGRLHGLGLALGTGKR